MKTLLEQDRRESAVGGFDESITLTEQDDGKVQIDVGYHPAGASQASELVARSFITLTPDTMQELVDAWKAHHPEGIST